VDILYIGLCLNNGRQSKFTQLQTNSHHSVKEIMHFALNVIWLVNTHFIYKLLIF